TKLAHLPFAATAQSRRRIVAMGEDPRWVWNAGSPAADGIRAVKPDRDAPDLIVVQHPIGERDAVERQWMQETLRAVAHFANRRVMYLAPNNDPGSRGIRVALESAGVDIVEHIPRLGWLPLLAGAR